MAWVLYCSVWAMRVVCPGGCYSFIPCSVVFSACSGHIAGSVYFVYSVYSVDCVYDSYVVVAGVGTQQVALYPWMVYCQSLRRHQWGCTRCHVLAGAVALSLMCVVMYGACLL